MSERIEDGGPVVTVKPLEWQDDEGFPTAKGLFGEYIVHPHYAQVDLLLGNGRALSWGLWSFQGKPGDSPDLLKDKAQEHHETIVRSALVARSPSEPLNARTQGVEGGR